jgi:D-aminopeptidase
MQKRLRDFGIQIGRLPTGPGNKITDVPGVLVGHCTIDEAPHHTGVTVILPAGGNIFAHKLVAAGYIHNGFGKTCGLPQVQELGTLETPIALTNTLNVGLVADALVDYTLEQCRADGIEALSINPVVGECNDSRINRIQDRAVELADVKFAFQAAKADFEEGSVGAGTGTVCYGLKGGIGSASRTLSLGGKNFTIGALVQANFGATEDFVLDGLPLGRKLKKILHKLAVSEQDQGSIMTVIATDLPLSSRQLYRLIRRAGVGIARTGGYTGHGSGEIMLGFSTANRICPGHDPDICTASFIREDLLNQAFLATAEAVQEAILNALVTARTTTGLKGEIYYSLAELLPLVHLQRT